MTNSCSTRVSIADVEQNDGRAVAEGAPFEERLAGGVEEHRAIGGAGGFELGCGAGLQGGEVGTALARFAQAVGRDADIRRSVNVRASDGGKPGISATAAK